jgi:hypothetical protein
MDHAEAIRHNAAERYAIGDLPLAEVEEFERHFFECPQCSEELRALSILASDARAVFLEPPPAPVTAPVADPVRPPAVEKVTAWWRQPWILGPAFAAVAVAITLSVSPGLHQSSGKIEQVSAFPLFASSRGSETPVTPAADSASYTLYMDKTWEGSSDSYHAVIRDEAGNAERASFTLKDAGPGRFLEISIPTRALAAGRYVLVVRDKDQDLARYPFTLRLN